MAKLTCPYHTDHPLNVSLKKLVCFSFEFITLFRKKKFLVNLITKRNASIFAMFMGKENPSSFFRFSFKATLIFTFINDLVYDDIHKGKMKVPLNEKQKKNTWIFFFHKHSKY